MHRKYTDSNSKAPQFSDYKKKTEEQEKAKVDISDGAAAATSSASAASAVLAPSEASSVRSAEVLSDYCRTRNRDETQISVSRKPSRSRAWSRNS